MPRTPCSGCALTPGSAANLEPHNAIKAQICVRAAIPFYCHDGHDWRDPLSHRFKTRADFRRVMMVPCAGWQREVAALAQAGWFKGAWRRLQLKVCGTMAFEELTLYLNADGRDKRYHRRRLGVFVMRLRKGGVGESAAGRIRHHGAGGRQRGHTDPEGPGAAAAAGGEPAG